MPVGQSREDGFQSHRVWLQLQNEIPEVLMTWPVELLGELQRLAVSLE
jgi:hypothetical protein